MKKIEEYMLLPYRMELIPDPDEGGYVVSFPDLPGCLSSGETYEEALKIITDGAGKHFDPKVVAAFEAAIDEVKAVCEKFSSDESYMGAPQIEEKGKEKEKDE